MEASDFGKFLILEKVAQGGMAEIFRAQLKLKSGATRVVALKKILPEFSKDEEFITLLSDEAKLMVTLNHPNIVPVIEFGIVDADYYLALEYVNGKTLKDIFVKTIEGAFDIPFEVAAFIIREIASGLDYAHRKTDKEGKPLNIIHRDISPTNVLVSYGGDVKIVDFGISKAASHSHVTRTGIIRGKMGYMSPEQTKSYLDIDARSDIYSVGILLYEMVTGRKLFDADNIGDAIKQVRKGEFDPPSKIRKGLPRLLDETIMRALEQDLGKRIQSAAALRDAMNEFLAETALRKNSGALFSARELAIYMQHLFRSEYSSEMETSARIPSARAYRFARQKEPSLSRSLVTNVEYELSVASEEASLKRAGSKEKRSFRTAACYILGTIFFAFMVVGTNYYLKGKQIESQDMARPSEFAALDMTVDPIGAEVRINGVKLKGDKGLFSAKIPVQRLALLTAQGEGYETQNLMIKPRSESAESINVILKKYQDNNQKILIFTEPQGAEVLIDGVSRGVKTPCLINSLKGSGSSRLALRYPGYKKKEVILDRSSGRTLFYDLFLEKGD